MTTVMHKEKKHKGTPAIQADRVLYYAGEDRQITYDQLYDSTCEVICAVVGSLSTLENMEDSDIQLEEQSALLLVRLALERALNVLENDIFPFSKVDPSEEGGAA